jgi:prolyl-tRNA synthetase
MSQLFSQTLREAPADAQSEGFALLVRAGFIRQIAAGIFTILPLGLRAIRKIETILRDEMNAIGGQELSMPVVLPADLWKETGRWSSVGAELARLKDRNERDLVLAMTHEEAVGDLVRREIQSYKQLPRLIYHIQTKFRDDPRPRAGLIRVREFTMKDSYSLDSSWEGLDSQYRAHFQAYFNIFRRCGVPAIAVKADTGMMGGHLAHEYMYLNAIGEDTIIICPQCGYTANRQVATTRKPVPAAEERLPLEKVHTPGMKTIADLAKYLQIPESRTAKAVFMIAAVPADNTLSDRLVMAIVRGDMELNETKLSNAVNAKELRPATEEEILASGAVPGFASPYGLQDVLVVVDELVSVSPNVVAGANQVDYHMKNVNYGRDFTTPHVADITAAGAGDACPDCGSALQAERGVEVGNIFKLGTWFSQALGCTFQDENGENQLVIMGSYGIGLGRLLGCAAEEHHDANGLTWPVSIAPFSVHLVLLPGKNNPLPKESADWLFDQLQTAGIDVLYDDREDSPGVKFNDADLIGIPVRLTVSARSLEAGGVEVKLRSQSTREVIPLESVIEHSRQIMNQLHQELLAAVVSVPYRE